MVSGFATPAGTRQFASRFPAETSAQFYREAQTLVLSSLGIGTYLGPMDDAIDASYSRAIVRALEGGINVIDTSLNYRNQRSERAIGGALVAWLEASGKRDEVLLCTKAGYLVPDAIPTRALRREDVVAGMHCIAPGFIKDQIERSRANLGTETLDVLYLHNPETQLGYVPEEIFYSRIRAAFNVLEELVTAGHIRFYGVATWEGFRRGGAAGSLSLERLEAIARETVGVSHHFRFVQLPVNLAMTEALSKPLKEGRTVLESASELGITVVASAALLQARLSRGLPDELTAALPNTSTDAQRAIQFARSAPGVTVALVGMSKAEHVESNLGIARTPPIATPDFARVFA